MKNFFKTRIIDFNSKTSLRAYELVLRAKLNKKTQTEILTILRKELSNMPMTDGYKKLEWIITKHDCALLIAEHAMRNGYKTQSDEFKRVMIKYSKIMNEPVEYIFSA